MCNTKSKGSFEVKFKAERSYQIFGREYAKCYANLESSGKMETPEPNGELSYIIRFRMDCGCDTVIGEFNKAYEKTFGNSADTISPSNQPDYVAWMNQCSLGESLIDSYRSQFSDAEAFFGSNLLPIAEAEDDPDRYADKDGLVEFVVAGTLIDDPAVMKKLTEQKAILVAVTSIVTDYINRYADTYGAAYKTDPDLWAQVVGKIPLMGPNKTDQQSYTRNIKGVEIAKDFIDFIMEVVVSEGSSALNSFTKFLEKQGDSIRFGIEENADAYNTITMGVTAEVFKVGNEIVYTPKIKLYRVNFTRENSKFTSACASYEQVDISFDYIYAASVFDYEALEDPEIKAEFDAFIKKQRKAAIADADTFFNDDFPLDAPPKLS